MEAGLTQTASTVLINASLAWMAGALASRFWLRTQAAPWQQAAVKRLSCTMTAGLAFCAAGMLLSLWSEAAAMGELPWLEAWPAVRTMLLSTHYGHAGVAVLAVLAATWLVHWRLRRSGAALRYVAIMTALVCLIAAARVTIGHAFERGPASAAVWLEWLHLLAMSLWTGVVFVAGWAVLPQVAANAPLSSLARRAYLIPMSAWATAAVIVIAVTGTFNLYRVLDSPRDLFGTGYGNVLVFKLVCVVIALILGGWNRFVGLPTALSSDRSPAQVQRGLRMVIAILRIESIVLCLALVGAAVMTNSAPPGQ